MMTVREYYVIASEPPYNPTIGDRITYLLELKPLPGRPAPKNKDMSPQDVVELTVHVTHVEDSWGPNTLRVEGFTRNPRTLRADRVFGHHLQYPQGETRIGVLQVTEGD